jgi:hypothetical protein
MEQKVDLMFQLIQEYEQNKNMRGPPPQNISEAAPIHSGGGQDLISVSDDDEEYSDSEEVSDNEDENTLDITETVSVDNIKSISLSGAEIEPFQMADDLDEISDIEEDASIVLMEINNDEITVVKSPPEEGVAETVEEMILETVSDKDTEKPLVEHSVKELKALAEQRGFTNYKALRKNKLVELLASQ